MTVSTVTITFLYSDYIIDYTCYVHLLALHSFTNPVIRSNRDHGAEKSHLLL